MIVLIIIIFLVLAGLAVYLGAREDKEKK